MKKAFVWVIALAVFALTPSFVHAQKGNPLKNMPVSDMYGMVSNAKISIDDFSVVDGEIWVTSTLTGTSVLASVSETVSYPVSIVSSSCSSLSLLPGVTISSDNFHIANFVVSVSAEDIKDKKLSAALCSIAELQTSNASPYVIVARIKQAVRALL